MSSRVVQRCVIIDEVDLLEGYVDSLGLLFLLP